MTFVLHHELIGEASARSLALVLHGALGSGQNFRGFIKKLARERPDTSFVLVDLRAHGDSHPAPAPHTLASAALDLRVLERNLRERTPELGPLTTLIGHSLGGKVALEYARRAPGDLERVFALDSDPGPQDGQGTHEIEVVMRAVRAVPQPVSSRADVVRGIERQGLSSGLAQWMTTNLRRNGEHYEWTFDLGAISELLSDYFVQDLWPFIEQPKTQPELHLVIAEQSDRWSDAMRSRAHAVSPAANVRVHSLPNSGHWVHVDNPAGLLDLMTSSW